MKYTLPVLALAAATSAQQTFTSIFNITATPDQVVNASSLPAPGQPGARGQFNYAINSLTNTICYDITLFGVSGSYQSPANTATHIHEAAVGRNGPPRIAFPNPVGDDTVRRSSGCLTGPFTTGVKAADNVTDTGAGFTLAQIEANPAGFFTDAHTNLFVPGVVRGQLSQSFYFLTPGSAITTATLTSTRTSTVTSCPATVVCPYTTVTPVVYTTTCPVSLLPGYTSARSVSTIVVVPATSIRSTVTSGAVVTTIVSSRPAATTTVAVAATNTPVGPAATTTRATFTGAANANKVGGVVFAAAGVVAALL